MFFKLFLTGILAVTLASAQRGGGGKGGANMPDTSIVSRPDKLTILTDDLKLSKDQRKLVKTVLDEGRRKPHRCARGGQKPASHRRGCFSRKSQDEIDQLVKSHAAIESRWPASR